MVTVRISQVPKYLHKSELFLSFSGESDDEISVPANCLKQTTNVNSITQLDHMLATARFWIMPTLPLELIIFAVTSKKLAVVDVLETYKLAFPHLYNLASELRTVSNKQSCNIAAKHGSIHLLKYFVGRNKPVNFQTLQAAAEGGNVECLLFCYDLLHEKNSSSTWPKLDWAQTVRRCRVHCIEALLERGLPAQQFFGFSRDAAASGNLRCLEFMLNFCPERDTRITETAARNRHLDCLIFAVEKGCEVTWQTWQAAMDKTFNRSASNSDTCCLEYLLKNHVPPEEPCNLLNLAIRSKNLCMLRFLHQKNFVFGDKTRVACAKEGCFDMLQYLHEHVGIPCWVPSTMTIAAGAGQLELVKRLHYQGCVWDESAIQAAQKSNKQECLKFLLFAQRCSRMNGQNTTLALMEENQRLYDALYKYSTRETT